LITTTQQRPAGRVAPATGSRLHDAAAKPHGWVYASLLRGLLSRQSGNLELDNNEEESKKNKKKAKRTPMDGLMRPFCGSYSASKAAILN